MDTFDYHGSICRHPDRSPPMPYSTLVLLLSIWRILTSRSRKSQGKILCCYFRIKTRTDDNNPNLFKARKALQAFGLLAGRVYWPRKRRITWSFRGLQGSINYFCPSTHLVYHHCRLLVQLRSLSELDGSTSKHSSQRPLDALPFVIVIDAATPRAPPAAT